MAGDGSQVNPHCLADARSTPPVSPIFSGMLMHRADSTLLCAQKALMLSFSYKPLRVSLQAISLPNLAASIHSPAAKGDLIHCKTTGGALCS